MRWTLYPKQQDPKSGQSRRRIWNQGASRRVMVKVGGVKAEPLSGGKVCVWMHRSQVAAKLGQAVEAQTQSETIRWGMLRAGASRQPQKRLNTHRSRSNQSRRAGEGMRVREGQSAWAGELGP